MKRAAALALVTVLASAAATQAQPVFDGSKGFRVIDALDADRVVVQNGPSFFVCVLRPAGNQTRYILDRCAAVVAPDQPRFGDSMTEADFLRLLDTIPDDHFASALRQTFRDLNCSAFLRGGQRARFQDRLAEDVAASLGYDGMVSPALTGRVVDAARPALDRMIRDGQVRYNQSTGVALLLNCR